MALFGVELDAKVKKINTEFRLFLSKHRGGVSIRNLRRLFEYCHINGNRVLEYSEF